MKDETMFAFFSFVFIMAMIVVGRMDYEDQVKEQSNYCARVADGTYPDYKHTYKAECGGKEPPKFYQEVLTATQR